MAQQAGYYGIPWGEARERAEACLSWMGLWEKRNAMARSLSGGMKRRLMIARALVHGPQLLILDEPTAGVDIEIRRATWTLLEQINAAGTTIILTTHYLEEAEAMCRRIAIIDGGRIVQDTDTRSLLRQLKAETFVLDPIPPRDGAPLHAAPQLPGFVTRLREDGSIEVDVERGSDLNALFRALDQGSVRVSSMRNKANRLEELFLGLVEQSKLDAGDAASRPAAERSEVTS